MESLLAKIYLLALFAILLIASLFLVFQISLRQNLEQRLTQLQIVKNDNSYKHKFKLGQMYLRQNLYKKAIKEFRGCALKWDENDAIGIASLFNTIGFTYFRLNEFKLAEYYYITALKIAPNYKTSLTNLLYLYQSQNNSEKAKLIYSRLSQIEGQ